MSKYIKREDAIRAYAEILKSDKDTKLIAEMILADVPSADVVEVRHGHWILRQPNSLHLDWRDSLFECSVCGANRIRRTGEVLNYCPNCGAKMDGEE